MTDASRYPAQVFFSEEDEGFIAVAADLPGCSAFGATQEEALAELQVAIDVWRGAATKAGNPIPPPSKPQADLPSGKVLVRMPRSLHGQLLDRAKLENTSLNQLVVHLLSGAVSVSTVAANMQKAFEWPHVQGVQGLGCMVVGSTGYFGGLTGRSIQVTDSREGNLTQSMATLAEATFRTLTVHHMDIYPPIQLADRVKHG